MRNSPLLVAVLLATVTPVPSIAQPGGPAAMQEAVRRVCRERAGATVAIARIRRDAALLVRDPFDPFGNPRARSVADAVPTEFGSGVLVRADENARPVVLTNYHVVRGGPIPGIEESDFELSVRLSTRHRFRASILAADPRSDLAILELAAEKLPSGLPVVTIAEPAPLERGDFVVAFGNPYAIARDGEPSASLGMVANLGRRPLPAGPAFDEETRRRETIHHFGTLLHLDGRLNLGTSGGPIFDLEGRFAGITTSMAALEGYEKSAGYAVPMDHLTLRVVRDLLAGYEVEYGFLGVEPLDFSQEQMAGLPATLVQASAAQIGRVFPNSPATRGLTPAGALFPNDVVLGVRVVGASTKPIRVFDKQDLIREVGQFPPGTPVDLDVYREHDRRRLTVRVRLGKWPVENEADIVAPGRRFPDWRSLRVDFPTGRRRHFGKPYVFHDAVLLIGVDAGADVRPAGDAPDLREGAFITHVNRQPVSSPSEFHRLTRNLSGPARVRTLDGNEYDVRAP